MKKLFLLAFIFMGFTNLSNAQTISDNAIGLRLGDSNGMGAEVSYQRALGDNNRLEFDLGWRNGNDYNGFKFTTLYHWVYNLEGAFNWYVGAGGGLGSFDGKNELNNVNDTFFYAAGDLGIEYSFDIPLLLSLDLRPELGFGNDNLNNNDLDFDIAFGIRYQF